MESLIVVVLLTLTFSSGIILGVVVMRHLAATGSAVASGDLSGGIEVSIVNPIAGAGVTKRIAAADKLAVALVNALDASSPEESKKLAEEAGLSAVLYKRRYLWK